MEQARRTRPHFERALLVVGDQNAGKSHLLREMFIDSRLGTGGKTPRVPRIRLKSISNERCLFVRCTSPHEAYETLAKFIRKIDRSMELAFYTHWRFNLACALQPQAANNMPDLVDTCERLIAEFQPERVRIAQISPRQDGINAQLLSNQQVDALRKMRVEFLTVDARRAGALNPNGFLFADFFDFT